MIKLLQNSVQLRDGEGSVIRDAERMASSIRKDVEISFFWIKFNNDSVSMRTYGINKHQTFMSTNINKIHQRLMQIFHIAALKTLYGYILDAI